MSELTFRDFRISIECLVFYSNGFAVFLFPAVPHPRSTSCGDQLDTKIPRRATCRGKIYPVLTLFRFVLGVSPLQQAGRIRAPTVPSMFLICFICLWQVVPRPRAAAGVYSLRPFRRLVGDRVHHGRVGGRAAVVPRRQRNRPALHRSGDFLRNPEKQHAK